jgi:hypothetical protein
MELGLRLSIAGSNGQGQAALLWPKLKEQQTADLQPQCFYRMCDARWNKTIMEMRPEVGSSPNVAHSVVPCVIALDSFHSYNSRDLPSTSPM